MQQFSGTAGSCVKPKNITNKVVRPKVTHGRTFKSRADRRTDRQINRKTNKNVLNDLVIVENILKTLKIPLIQLGDGWTNQPTDQWTDGPTKNGL